MALYRHVTSKDELLARMADSVLSTLPPMREDVDWQEAVVELFVALRDLMLQHPGLAELMLLRTTGEPIMLRAADTALRAMEGDGLTPHQAVTTLAMLQWSTLGAALHGVARETRRAEELPPVIAAVDPAHYPALARARQEFSEGARREQFRQGLFQLLRGLERA